MSEGALAATIAIGILAGAGGLIGSTLASWVGHHHAAYLRGQIENGRLLLWRRAWTAAHEARALAIVNKHAASHVHTHGMFGAEVAG